MNFSITYPAPSLGQLSNRIRVICSRLSAVCKLSSDLSWGQQENCCSLGCEHQREARSCELLNTGPVLWSSFCEPCLAPAAHPSVSSHKTPTPGPKNYNLIQLYAEIQAWQQKNEEIFSGIILFWIVRVIIWIGFMDAIKDRLYQKILVCNV